LFFYKINQEERNLF